jgi:hypothetical protein
MSGHATGPKDLLRHLKTAFGSTEAVFATCSPPAELITLVDEYLSAKRDPEETSKLLLGLADLTESVASARYQGLDQGKCSAWLDLIAPLCLSATTSSARLESSTALWDRLLKPIFIPGKTSGPVLSRSALVAAKELALWCLASREDFSSSSKLSSAEDTLLTAYLDGSARAADVSRLEDLLLAIGKHSKVSRIFVPRQLDRPHEHIYGQALLPTLKIRLSTRPTDRAAILDLLLALVRHHSNIVHTLIPAGVFEDVLLCILVEVDPSVLQYVGMPVPADPANCRSQPLVQTALGRLALYSRRRAALPCRLAGLLCQTGLRRTKRAVAHCAARYLDHYFRPIVPASTGAVLIGTHPMDPRG